MIPPFEHAFHELAALLFLAALLGGLATRLRQPLIVSFIAVGILVGPAVLGWTQVREQVALLAELGIALLLFVVGLKLDFRLVRKMGAVALATGLGQVAFTSIGGFLLALALGLEPVAATYVAVALTFSSTIIIVKLLSDKREIDSLHGRIAVGFLIVQDIVVVLVMIVLSAFGGEAGEAGIGWDLLMVLTKGLGMLVGLGLLARFVLPALLQQLARSQELLVLFAIAWAVALGSLGEGLGFSAEVGAFLGGVSLASTPFRESIGARLVSLRDFLLLFFFVALGSNLEMGLLGAQVGRAVVLSAFVLIGNPLIVMVIMGGLGYRKRTGFLAGLTVAQISEFSLVLAALGAGLGHIDEEVVALITLVGLITIGLSTYLILFSRPIYERLAPFLSIFERTVPHREQAEDQPSETGTTDVIVFGLGRYGDKLAQGLRERGLSVLGVDFDPEAVHSWHQQGYAVHYGDAEDPELAALLPLQEAKWVVSTMPQRPLNLVLLAALADQGYAGRTAVTAHNEADAEALREAGCTHVLMPFVDAAREAALDLVDGLAPVEVEADAEADAEVSETGSRPGED